MFKQFQYYSADSFKLELFTRSSNAESSSIKNKKIAKQTLEKPTFSDNIKKRTLSLSPESSEKKTKHSSPDTPTLSNSTFSGRKDISNNFSIIYTSYPPKNTFDSNPKEYLIVASTRKNEADKNTKNDTLNWVLELKTFLLNDTSNNNKDIDYSEPSLGIKLKSLSTISFQIPFENLEEINICHKTPTLDNYSLNVLNIDVISEDFDRPYPSVLLGWSYHEPSVESSLERLTYIQFSPNFQTAEVSKTDRPTNSKDSLLWQISSLHNILSSITIPKSFIIGAVLSDGPFAVLSLGSKSIQKDSKVVLWDILNHSIFERDIESSSAPLGLLRIDNINFIIHAYYTSKNAARLLATSTSLLFPFEADFSLSSYIPLENSRKWWLEFDLNIAKAHKVSSLFIDSVRRSKKVPPFKLQGWYGLFDGFVEPIGNENYPSTHISVSGVPNSIAMVYEKCVIAIRTDLSFYLIPLNDSGHSKELIFSNLKVTTRYNSAQAYLHVILEKNNICMPVIWSRNSNIKMDQHPVLESVQKRLLARCQVEAIQLSEKRNLLMQKLKLVRDGLELLQNIGHEHTSRPGLPLTSFPPVTALLKTSKNVRSYYPLPNMIDTEIEENPAFESKSVPLFHRLSVKFKGCFMAPGLILGQFWVRVHATNIHCKTLYNIRLHASLIPSLEGDSGLLEFTRYWLSETGNELLPNESTESIIMIKIVRVPYGYTLGNIWPFLRLSASWDEKIEGQFKTTTFPIELPNIVESNLGIDQLPIPPLILSISSKYSFLADIQHFLSNTGFFDVEPNLSICSSHGLAIHFLTQKNKDFLIRIKGIHPSLLWDFLTRFINHLNVTIKEKSSPSSNPPLKFLSHQFLKPGSDTLHRFSKTDFNGNLDLGLSQSLLAYLMTLRH